jgi:phage FluMu protein Com
MKNGRCSVCGLLKQHPGFDAFQEDLCPGCRPPSHTAAPPTYDKAIKDRRIHYRRLDDKDAAEALATKPAPVPESLPSSTAAPTDLIRRLEAEAQRKGFPHCELLNEAAAALSATEPRKP